MNSDPTLLSVINRLYQPGSYHFRAPYKTGADEKIHYIYNSKAKLQKTYYEDNRLMSTTDYSGIFVYKDRHIDYIQTSEGRLKWNDHDSLFYAEYFIKDHLGNVRDVITTDPNYTN